ncbi:MAG: GHKL domain-containing protein [Candidatus Planktophila sp.]|nr:GHKL domain-containing protein [Candidatus Planktophila sp.]
MGFLRRDTEVSEPGLLPQMLLETLASLDGESVILALGEVPIFSTAGVESLGILRENRIQSPELLATVRFVRRTGSQQIGQIEIPRGPIGEGKHQFTFKVLPLVKDDLVLVLVSDESEAQRVHDVRRDFVANISHELKTPIGALSLLSEAVLGAKDDPESVTKFATRMQSEAKRLTDLVQEIINLSRVQDSDPLQLPQEVSIGYVIREAIDQCEISAESRGISVKYAEPNNVLVLGDRDQLIMAIHNLIENAINYSPESTKVSISTKIEDKVVSILVADQGIGISESDQERIFERFYRVDPARSRQTGGTGLGLSIVKHVANKHGGEVTLWSVENVGSTFSIRLPIHSFTSEKE